MRESEWENCEDPVAMVEFLHHRSNLPTRKYGPFGFLPEVSTDTARKLRLLGCACLRRVWHLLTDEASRTAVEAAEQLERIGKAELARVESAAREVAAKLGRQLSRNPSELQGRVWAATAASAALDEPSTGNLRTILTRTPRIRQGEPGGGERARDQVRLLRDIFFTPFSPLPTIPRSVLAWNDGCIPKLARAAYDNRTLPSGHLDPDTLAILADAVEEAEADDEGLLSHLRGAGPHVMGCFGVEACIGNCPFLPTGAYR